jgi:MinD-like ATPase involved in chromosome partitioning or flagellar assembly
MANKKGVGICVASCKGGVGKTTILLCLAGIYHSLNKKTLIIDLDLYNGGVAVSLNLNNKKDISDLVYDIDNNHYKNFEDYITSYNKNIDVLVAPKDPRTVSKIKVEHIENIISYAKLRYDVILMDTTHILNEINLLAMDKSDTNLFIITNDLLDLKNTRTVMSILKEAEKENNKFLLYEARDTGKDYYSLYDIKSIIKNNIDYTISKSFYIKNIDKYIIKGNILTLNNAIIKKEKKDYNKFYIIARDLLNEKGAK